MKCGDGLGPLVLVNDTGSEIIGAADDMKKREEEQLCTQMQHAAGSFLNPA